MASKVKRNARPSVLNAQDRNASPADIASGADFRKPRFLKQFVSPEGLILPRKQFPYLQKKVYKRLARRIKTSRNMGLLDVLSRRVGGGAGAGVSA